MSAYNLDDLLDKIRTEYYHSEIMKRPTISWLDDFIKVNKINKSNVSCVCEIIKLCVILNRIEEAEVYYEQYSHKLPKDDLCLNNGVEYISKLSYDVC